MGNKKRVVMIGPFPGELNGMTIANQMLYDGMSTRDDIERVDYLNTIVKGSKLNYGQQGRFQLKKAFYSLKPIFQGVSKIIFNKWDVVYITPAQSYIGFIRYIPYIFASKLKGTKCYIHFHGGFVKQMYDSLSDKKKGFIRKWFNKCDGIIVLGNSLVEMLDNIVPHNKIKVCENGVQQEYILSSEEFDRKSNDIKEDSKLRILYLSNLMKTKGILELLDACIKMKEENIDFSIDIAGKIENDIEKDVRSKFDQLGDTVVYHGIVNGESKKELLHKTNIFCLPTYYPNEGQPISILEAMCNGCAILTCDQGGISDIVQDGCNGIMCKPNSESIFEKMLVLKVDKYKYINKAYNEAVLKYSQKGFVDRIYKILFE